MSLDILALVKPFFVFSNLRLKKGWKWYKSFSKVFL